MIVNDDLEVASISPSPSVESVSTICFLITWSDDQVPCFFHKGVLIDIPAHISPLNSFIHPVVIVLSVHAKCVQS